MRKWKYNSTENGKTSNLYHVWRSMINRCSKPQNKDYKFYGGRGISVCLDWNSYDDFYEWSYSNGYNTDLQIDRIDTNGNYEPINCRFIPALVNNSNRRPYGEIKYKGVSVHGLKFVARIRHNKSTYIGLFSTAEEAAKAYDKYVIENELNRSLNFKY